MLDISPVQYPEPQVSVPYRGATFLNTPSFFVITPLKARFPSPIGELHFSIIDTLMGEYGLLGFRPLSGSYISQLHLKTGTNLLSGFRPLSGSYISQY